MLRVGGAALLLVLLAGCGGGAAAPPSQSSFSANLSGVDIGGRVTQRGTRGSELVFAYVDLKPADDPSTREAAAVGIVGDDGTFDLSVPDGGSITLVFLADAANDGVIDRGDASAVLSAAELADLQPGDRVQINDAAIDFPHRHVTATIEVARLGGEPDRTPTAVPSGA